MTGMRLGDVPGLDAVLADPFAGLDNAVGTLTVNSLGQMLGQDTPGPLGALDFSGTGTGAFDFRPVQADGTLPGTGMGGPGGGGGGGGGGAFYLPTGSGGDGSSGQFGIHVNDIGSGGTYLLPDGTPAYQGGSVGVWSKTQIQNAQVIAKVGQKLGATPRDIQVAIMAAMTESSLQNLDYGDRDSVGLFQQRSAWGSFADRTNPVKAAEMFFQGGANGQRGLFDIQNRDQMSLGQAAQAVQVSAFPGRYAKYQSDARQLIDMLGRGGTTANAAGPWRQNIVAQAKKYLGTPYVWGGTSPTGFDCSGFVQYVYRQMGVDLPRISYQQANAGPHIALDALKPGDLVGWDLNSRNPGADHIAIYVGNGNVIEAPRPGTSVQIAPIFDPSHAWGVSMDAFAPRPISPPAQQSRSGDRTAPVPGSVVRYEHFGGRDAPEPSGSGGFYHPPHVYNAPPTPPTGGSHTEHSKHHPGGHDIPLA